MVMVLGAGTAGRLSGWPERIRWPKRTRTGQRPGRTRRIIVALERCCRPRDYRSLGDTPSGIRSMRRPANLHPEVALGRAAADSVGNSTDTMTDQGRCWVVCPDGPVLCHSRRSSTSVARPRGRLPSRRTCCPERNSAAGATRAVPRPCRRCSRGRSCRSRRTGSPGDDWCWWRSRSSWTLEAPLAADPMSAFHSITQPPWPHYTRSADMAHLQPPPSAL